LREAVTFARRSGRGRVEGVPMDVAILDVPELAAMDIDMPSDLTPLDSLSQRSR
jgi:hypothetical protein